MNELLHAFWWIFSIAGITLTLPGSFELLFLTTGALLFRKRTQTFDRAYTDRLAVIIPAHNEEKGICATIDSVRASDASIAIIVIADHCQDKTVELCVQRGVRVLERNGAKNRGKPAALQWAFERLLKEKIDAFMVIDADSEIHTNTLTEVKKAFASGSHVIQTRDDIKNPGQSWRHRLTNIGRLAFNYTRPLGRAFWGLSTGIFGNGFALKREVLEKVPFNVSCLAEDAAYHLRLIEAGYKVDFIDRAVVLSEIPALGKGMVTQAVRWDGGRLQNLKRELFPLIRSLLRGKYSLAEPALELLLLPLAYHSCLVLLLLLSPISLAQSYAIFALGALAYHLFATLYLARAGIQDLLALSLAPFYLLWKLINLLFVFLHLKKGGRWERTER